MREVDRTRLIQANRCRVRRRFVCRLAMVLCLLSGVATFGFLGERNLRGNLLVSAARPEQAGLGKLIPPASVVGRREGDTGVSPVIEAQDARATSRLAKLSKSDRSQDDLWRLQKKSAKKTISAGAIEEFRAGLKF